MLIAQMADQLATMNQVMGPFLGGHPLLCLQEPSDVNSFDGTTGWGSGIWAGWAKANGNTYTNGTTTIVTYDMRDKVPVGSDLTYAVGDSIGEMNHVLTIPEIPVHTHAPTDPGHTHTLTDPGHHHAVIDPGHTHAASQVAHAHTLDLGDHTHDLPVAFNIVDGHTSGTAYNAVDPNPGSGGTLVTGVNNTPIAGTTDSSTPAITVSPAFMGTTTDDVVTGETVDSEVTGITIATVGGDQAHNNMQPSVGSLWVQKIYQA